MGGYIGARSGVGLVTTTVGNVQDLTATDTTPEVTIVNSTHEDTDGGREGKVIFKGQQSGGEETTLAEIQGSHDGTADDEKGDLIFKTNDGSDGASPTERLRIDSTGKSTFKDDVGIEGATPTLQMYDTTVTNNVMDVSYDEFLTLDIDPNNARGNSGLIVKSDGNERMRLDSAGRLLIGTTTEGNANADDLTISGSGNIGMTIRSTNSGESNIYFSDGTSGGPEYVGYAAYNHGDNTLRIGTNAVERMRIRNDGYFRIGDANSQAETYTGANVIMTSLATTFGNHGVDIAQGSYTGAYNVLYFRNGNGGVGYIQTNGSSTTYSTGSDYRLKENVTDISDGITRVKQLKPSRFNFIADADKTVDGFLAHEAATVVPEAVTGTKDAVQVWKEHEKDELPDGVSVGDNKLDDVGNTIPEIQGIDQGKLVPLLTAALQEAIAKIETLEAQNTTQATQIADLITRVTALEAE